MMLCVMMLLPVVVGQCNIKAVCQSVREATISPPAWIMQPRLADTAERIISPSERLITMQKQLSEPRSTMSSADRVAHVDAGQLICNYCEQFATTALPAET